MKLSKLFKRCLDIKYIHVENAGDYALDYKCGTLYIYFQHSSGIEDWKNNIDFPAKPYERMGKNVWFAHRGFLKVWKSMEPHLERYVKDRRYKNIITVGYSHGAALAALCHEYVWFNRPDLRGTLEGYGFGSPRVLWGLPSLPYKYRWERFCVIRNIDDLVTHLPPAAFGYFHVGKVREVGERDKYSSIDAHRPESYIRELESI